MIKTVIGVSFLLLLAMDPVYSETGIYRGHQKISVWLSERLYTPGSDFHVGDYIAADPGLYVLLGGYQGRAMTNHFVNAKANSLNLLLYQVVAERLSKDLVSNCTKKNVEDKKKKLRDGVKKLLYDFCHLDSKRIKQKKFLRKFWTLFLGFSQNESDFTEWLVFTRKLINESSSRHRALANLLKVLFLHPRFLLEK